MLIPLLLLCRVVLMLPLRLVEVALRLIPVLLLWRVGLLMRACPLRLVDCRLTGFTVSVRRLVLITEERVDSLAVVARRTGSTFRRLVEIRLVGFASPRLTVRSTEPLRLVALTERLLSTLRAVPLLYLLLWFTVVAGTLRRLRLLV